MCYGVVVKNGVKYKNRSQYCDQLSKRSTLLIRFHGLKECFFVGGGMTIE